MDPNHNFALAQFLSKRPSGPDPECSIRGACGRAYYAAFGVVRDVLLAAKFKFAGNADDHKRIVSLMKRSSDVDVNAAAGLLESLRRTRNSADYDVGRQPLRNGPFIPKAAETAILLAFSVIETAKDKQRLDRRLYIPAGIP